MAKVLLVEDDIDLADTIVSKLKEQKFTVEVMNDGLDAHEALISNTYDIIILDWNLPSMDGFEILSSFRASGGLTPVIMLTGKSDIDDKTQGLDGGADDYLTKPFHIKELVARMHSLMRRPPQLQANKIEFGNLVYDCHNHQLFKNGQVIHLLPRDMALLELFLRHPLETFSVDAIMARVWRHDDDCSPGAVRTAIARIRKAIDESEEESIIENAPRIGYRLRRPSNF